MFDSMITASIVVFSDKNTYKPESYKNQILSDCISDLTNNKIISKVFIVDNSFYPLFSWVAGLSTKVIYKHMEGENLGYGRGHNLARKYLDLDKYHIIVNPDIKFIDKEVIEKLFEILEKNVSYSLLQPLIVSFPSGNLQKLCKRNPTLLIQILRGFLPFLIYKFSFFKKYNDWYEMSNVAYSKKFVESQYLSGCFMFCRVEHLNKVGWFDEKYFLYLEDADLTRMLSKVGKCVHNPNLKIGHLWGKGSHKNFKLRFIAIYSFFLYSLKWGIKIF